MCRWLQFGNKMSLKFRSMGQSDGNYRQNILIRSFERKNENGCILIMRRGGGSSIQLDNIVCFNVLKEMIFRNIYKSLKKRPFIAKSLFA